MGFCLLEKANNHKKKHRKGLWSPEEDERLRNYILKHGHGCWTSVPTNAGLERNGKSCRLRWINYLRPGLKRGAFSLAEEETILTLHTILGNKWSQMAHHLPGRSDNEIKNHWHSYLKKRPAPKMDQIQRLQSSDQNLSLPRVMFAEWLSLDMDLGNTNNSFNNINNNGGETSSFVDDDMLPSSPFNSHCHIPIHYFSPDFSSII